MVGPMQRTIRPELTCSYRILETVHTVFCIQFVYAYLVSSFGDFEYFGQINWCVQPLSAQRSHSFTHRRGIGVGAVGHIYVDEP